LKFNLNSYWFKSGIFSLLQNLSTLIFGFGGFYFLVRILSKEDFGGWTLFLTVTSILEVTRVGFIKNGFIKFRAAASEELHGVIFTASFILNCCFALLISASVLIFGSTLATVWDTPPLKTVFYIYSITSLVLIPFFQFEFLLHAVLDFRSVFLTYFVRNGFLFFAILMSYLGILKIDLVNLVIFHLAGALLSSVTAYFFVKKNLGFSFRLDWSWIWKLVHFGKYASATSLSSMLYSGADQFMLGSMVSTVSVAIYSTANRVTNLINIPSLTLSTILFPRSAQAISTGGKAAVKELYEKSVGSILAIVLPAVLFVSLFPEFVITTVAGAGYIDSVPILKITVLFTLLLPFSYQFGTVFDSIGYPNLNFYYTSINLLVNITLNYFLILNYGIMGAVYGTSFTALAGFIVMQAMLRKKLNVNTLKVFAFTAQFYKDGFLFIKGIILKTKNETI